jgi:uncharacterized membrane protein
MTQTQNARTVDLAVSRLLTLGTWSATASIALGYFVNVSLLHPMLGSALCWLGVITFVMLPVASVLTMLIVYLRQRDWAFGATSFLVLFIISVGGLVAAITSR